MPTFGACEIWTILPRFLQISGVAPEKQLSTESIHHTELLPGSFASTIWVPTVVRFWHQVRVAGCVDPSLKTKVANQIVSVFLEIFQPYKFFLRLWCWHTHHIFHPLDPDNRYSTLLCIHNQGLGIIIQCNVCHIIKCIFLVRPFL